jgi:predicted phage-related endonuclease
MRVNGRLRSDRRSFIGGSDARIIMGEDEAALLRLWREKRGEAEPEDLSGELLVQLGTATEHLNRHWYEKNTGQVVTEVQRQVFHAVHRWMAATLDGRVEATGAVFEAKFMLPWNFSEEGAAEKHMAQLQHNMWVTAARVFCRTRAVYLEHDSARAELKKLVPEDAKEAIGHGVRAKRSKSGAISFDLVGAD